MKIPVEIDIAIVAPFPTTERIREGWMSRISVVDSILKHHKRLYINFAEHHNGKRDNIFIRHGDGFEVLLSPSDTRHQEILGRIIEQVHNVYVHTVHLAEYIQPWLSSGKFIIDFHGIVPEEEVMQGHPERAPKYEILEQKVIQNAKMCVMVTNAMRKHYQKKYPKLSLNNVIILPIVDEIQNRVGKNSANTAEIPVKAVYAGGTQTWQNIEAMLCLCSDTKEFASFTFLSHDWQIIQQKAKSLNCPGSADFRFCEKKELALEYAMSDFGLVLRDDTAVNRVSCPTKLYEYLSLGLVPIVRTPSLGDFEELGYYYITENEFRNKFFPDLASRKWMIEKNRVVVNHLRKQFIDGANHIIQLMKQDNT